MRTRGKLLVTLLVIVAVGAWVVSALSASRVRRLSPGKRLALVEQHYADLTTSHGTLEEQVQALAIRVAQLESRLAQCGCSAGCTPCQEQGLCTAEGAACGADADGDGVDDCLDRCPCEPGDPAQGGCAPPPPPPCAVCACADGSTTCGHDADADGIDDCADRCPCEPGAPEAGGCPPTVCRVCDSCQIVPCGHDADADGLDDCQDACPCDAGPAENKGCPTGTPCATDGECDDGNGCSSDTCVDGFCRHECLCLGPAGFDCCPGPVATCPTPLR